jgi:hypothetical protein
MSNEIVKSSLTEIMSIGKAFAESGMFPDIKTAAQAVVKIQAGAEMGIPPFAAMSGIHIIQGKPTVGAGLMAANVKGSGKYDYRVIESTEKVCSIDFYQKTVKSIVTDGKVTGSIPSLEFIGNSTFTEADAKKAGTKNLDKFPKNMLFARAISNGVKWYTPDVFSGPVYVPEEMETPIITEDVKHEQVPTPEELEQAIKNIALCDTKKDLTDLKKSTPAYIVSDASFIAAGKARYEVIMATPA